LAIAIVGGVMILLDTHWGFVALVAVAFGLPFASLPFSVGFKPTFLDVALGALFFVWLLKLVTGREREFVTSPMGLLVAIFMLLALFSFVYGMTHSRATSFTVRRFAEILLGIALFFVVINTVRTQGELEWVSRWVLLASWVCAFIAVIFYVIPEAWTVWTLDRLARFDYPGGYGALRWIEDDPSGTMRAIGTAVDPNVLGGMMILAAGALAPQLVTPRPLFPRLVVLLMFGTAALALYWTYSRSALFGMAAALALPAMLKYRRLIPFAIVGGLLLFLLPQTQDYVARLLAGLAGEDLATQMRFGEYKDALILIQRYPLFGVGFTGVPDIDLYLGVSMLYLIMAENMGLIGLAVFLVSMAAFFVVLLRGWRRGYAPEREDLVLGYGGAVLGALVSGLADHYWFNMTYPHMTVLFWLYLGLAMAVAMLEERSASHACRN
ncbi:MAG: polymerase, partial [Caldilineae bacterium]